MRPDLRGMLRRGLLQRGNGSQREQRHLPADAYGRLLSGWSHRPRIRRVPFHLDAVIHLVDVGAAVIKVAHRRPSAASTNNKRKMIPVLALLFGPQNTYRRWNCPPNFIDRPLIDENESIRCAGTKKKKKKKWIRFFLVCVLCVSCVYRWRWRMATSTM